MEITAKKLNEALYLWANDSRTLKELKAAFLAKCSEDGLEVEKVMKFIDIFIPGVIERREKRIIAYYRAVWRQCVGGRRREKMKAAAMCGFFAREAREGAV